MPDGERDATVEALRRVRRNVSPVPSTIVAIMRDRSKSQPIVVSGRRKWDRLERILSGLDWIRLECFDESGGLLDVVPLGEDEATGPSIDDLAAASPDDQETRRVQVVLAAVDRLAERQTKMLSATMDGISAVVGAMQTTLSMMVQRMAHLERDHADALKMIRIAAEQAGDSRGEAGGIDSLAGDVLSGVIAKSLSPEQRQMLGGLVGQIASGALAQPGGNGNAGGT